MLSERLLQTENLYSCLRVLTLTSISSKFFDISSYRPQVIGLKVTIPLLFLYTLENSEFGVLVKRMLLLGKTNVDANSGIISEKSENLRKILISFIICL